MILLASLFDVESVDIVHDGCLPARLAAFGYVKHQFFLQKRLMKLTSTHSDVRQPSIMSSISYNALLHRDGRALAGKLWQQMPRRRRKLNSSFRLLANALQTRHTKQLVCSWRRLFCHTAFLVHSSYRQDWFCCWKVFLLKKKTMLCSNNREESSATTLAVVVRLAPSDFCTRNPKSLTHLLHERGFVCENRSLAKSYVCIDESLFILFACQIAQLSMRQPI